MMRPAKRCEPEFTLLLLSLTHFFLFWKEKLRIWGWRLFPFEFPLYLRQTRSSLCEERCEVTSSGNSQPVTSSTVTLPTTCILIYKIILWLRGWMAHHSWCPVHASCIQRAHWEWFLPHGNIQTMPGCCPGQCKFAQVKTVSREQWTM